MNIALIIAAGVGARMGQDIPKQFIHVDNKPVIIHTMEAFQNYPGVDAIMVVTLPAWIDVLKTYASQFNITKLKWVIAGGATGQETIKNGVMELKKHLKEDDVVMVHDANRCMVSADILSDNLATFKEHGSAITAIPCVEAVFRSEDDGVSSTISVPRQQLFRTQTPQTYTIGKLVWAHEKAAELNITNSIATCTLMQELGETIYFSKGSEENLKITTVEDLMIMKALMKTKKDSWLK